MLKNLTDAYRFIEKQKEIRNKKLQSVSVYVCVGTGCTAKGALKVYNKFKELIERENLNVSVFKIDDAHDGILKKTGCCGRCSSGPLVSVQPYGYFYAHVGVDDVEKIVERTLKKERSSKSCY